MQEIKLWIINSYISDYWFRPKPIKPLCVSAKGLGPLPFEDWRLLRGVASHRRQPSNGRSSRGGSCRWHKEKPRKQADVEDVSFSDFGCRDFACSFICHAWKSCHSADTALACFYGFSCCDASLRHEGCCFSVVGLPKLASKHADNREATKGAAIASQQVFCWFWSKIIWMSVNPYLYKNINSIIHYNLGWRIDEVGKYVPLQSGLLWQTAYYTRQEKRVLNPSNFLRTFPFRHQLTLLILTQQWTTRFRNLN